MIRFLPATSADISRIWAAIIDLHQEVKAMSGTLQDKIDELKADVAAEHAANEAILVKIAERADQLKAALDAAKAGGATDAQLADLEGLHTQLVADTSALTAAATDGPGAATVAGGGQAPEAGDTPPPAPGG